MRTFACIGDIVPPTRVRNDVRRKYILSRQNGLIHGIAITRRKNLSPLLPPSDEESHGDRENPDSQIDEPPAVILIGGTDLPHEQ